MKTHILLTGAVGVLGTTMLLTNVAFAQPEYLHFTRHRDSNGNLVVVPKQIKAGNPSATQTGGTLSNMSSAPMSQDSNDKPSSQPQESSAAREQETAGMNGNRDTIHSEIQKTEQPSNTEEVPSESGEPMISSPESQEMTSVVQKTVIPSQPKSLEHQRANWGMTPQEIKNNEIIPPSWELQPPLLEEYEHRVAYRTQVEEIDTALTYTFYQDQLARAKYVFEPNHEDPADFVKDFQVVQDWVSQSYGPPTSTREIWLDNLYKYDQSLWGQALMRGHLMMVAEWNTPETQISLVLDGGDDQVGMVADFASISIQMPVLAEETTPSEDQQIPEVNETEPQPERNL